VMMSSIDHFVLKVRDVKAICGFYSRVLGMEVEEFEGRRRALNFGRQKINLHQSGKEFESKADKPTPGSSDFCLITDVSLGRVVDHVRFVGRRDPGRASRANRAIYRYEDEGQFKGSVTDLPVDAEGLVLDYPGLLKRVCPD
jgi:catechol-2,3-dioxygenase